MGIWQPRLKLLGMLLAVNLFCLATGYWIFGRLAISATRQAAEQEITARLDEALDSLDAFLISDAPGAQGLEGADTAAVRRAITAAKRLPATPAGESFPSSDVAIHWLWADPQWRITEVLPPLSPTAPENDTPTTVGIELTWTQPPPHEDAPWERWSGTVQFPGGLHAAMAVRSLDGGFLVAHVPLEQVRLSPSTLHGALGLAGVTAWLWTAAILVIAVILLLARFFDELARRQAEKDAEALRRSQALVRTRNALIFGLAAIAESRHGPTGRHVERVAYYAARLATAARHHPRFAGKITTEFIENLAASAVLHDLGKVAISDAILLKPGPLTSEERARMEQHSSIGAGYLREIADRVGRSAVFDMAHTIARWHHEWWDGTGYPDGLAGEQIPLAARIVAIADVYEALSSRRDYKPAFDHTRCVAIIREGAGSQFDPELVEVFLSVERSFWQLAYQYADDEAPEARAGESSADGSEVGVDQAPSVEPGERASPADGRPADELLSARR